MLFMVSKGTVCKSKQFIIYEAFKTFKFSYKISFQKQKIILKESALLLTPSSFWSG